MPEIVAHIEEARTSGVDVAADTYAYPAWFNTFSAVIPPWAHDGGDKKLIERLKDPAMRARIRKEMETPSSDMEQRVAAGDGAGSDPGERGAESEADAAAGQDASRRSRSCGSKDPIDTVFDLLIEDEAFTMVAMFIMDEPDVALALRQPWVSICNDSQGTAPDGAARHRSIRIRARTGRFRGSCASTCAKTKLLTLEDAIRKFTSLPAQRMRFADRGVLKEGMWADVVVFDPETVRDPRPSTSPISFRRACGSCW